MSTWLDPAPTTSIGVDIGGSKITAGLALPDGRVFFDVTTATPAAAGPTAIIGTTVDLIAQVRKHARDNGFTAPTGIGVGSAGVIDPATGVVLSSTTHLARWAGTPLADVLADRTGLPVRVVNDVHAHAIGEARHGAGRGHRTVLVIAAGTGIGGSLIINGDPMIGSRHAAGHFGHVPAAEAADLACSCGRRGHLEAVASGTGLLDLFRRQGGHASDTRDVIARAGHGDRLAVHCVSIAAGALGRAIGGWVNTLDPDVVVVTGGLSQAGPLWWSNLTRGATDQYIDAVANCPLLPAQRGNHAAILGAADFATVSGSPAEVGAR